MEAMQRYWTNTIDRYCYDRRCRRVTRQVEENRVENGRVVKRVTCYRCVGVTTSVGPTLSRQVLGDLELARR